MSSVIVLIKLHLNLTPTVFELLSELAGLTVRVDIDAVVLWDAGERLRSERATCNFDKQLIHKILTNSPK